MHSATPPIPYILRSILAAAPHGWRCAHGMLSRRPLKECRMSPADPTAKPAAQSEAAQPVHRVARRNRSADRRGDPARAWPPARRDRADRVGEHRQPRGAGGAGLGPHQQICRGAAGAALLRRLPVCRHRGNPGDRTGYQAFRMRFRERAAALRRVRQRRGVPGDDAARAIPSSGSTSPPAGTSPTARRSTCPANGSSRCPTACGATTSASTWTRSRGSRASTSRR